MAESRRHVDKAIGDAQRGRIAAVRAAGGCAWLKAYRACGLRALEKSDIEAASLAKEHDISADTEIDEEIEVASCAQHPDGRGLLKMDDSVIMVVTKDACIVQTEEDGETVQVHFEANGEKMIWLNVEQLQVEFRSDMTIVHFGRKLHVVLERETEGVTVLYDEGPVKQVTLTDDGRAGIRMREEESAVPAITLEKAQERRDAVSAARDEANALMPSVKEAMAAAEAQTERAKLAYEAASEKDKAFRDARPKFASKDAGDGLVDVALDDGFLAQVSSKRVELVQLPDKFDSAQLQMENDGEWTWGCNGGINAMRADGTCLVKLTNDVSSKVNKDTKIKIARVQLMPNGDRIVVFEDGSRLQLIKDGDTSFIRDPSVLVLSESFCTLAGGGTRSKLEDGGDFIHEEDSGLSWALRENELVVLSAGHTIPKETTEVKAKERKPRRSKVEEEPPAEEKKETPAPDAGKDGLVEDAVSEEPLPLAAVRARPLSTSESTFSVACVADDDGRFDLERTEDVVVWAEKAGYAPELARVSQKTLAICLKLWPLAVTKTFNCQEDFTLKHEGCRVRMLANAVIDADGVHTGSARLDLSLPPSKDGLSLYAGIAEDAKDSDASLSGHMSITMETSATLRDGAPFPVAWTLDADAARERLPTIERKSFVFRTVFGLPGVYIDLGTSRTIQMEVEIAVRRLLQREYQRTSGKTVLDQPRVYVAHTAIKLMVCGIAEVKSDEVAKISPLLLAEAKKEGPLKDAMDKCRVKEVTEARIQTTYEEIVDWVSTGIYVDSIELPSVDEETLITAHAEFNLSRELADVASKLSRASGLVKEADAASELKNVPGALNHLAFACNSLFTEAKKTAEQIGGWNHFRKQLKTGLLGRCSHLNPYEVPKKVIERTQQLAKFDDAKLQADYPAAALLAAWLREFIRCATTLRTMGVCYSKDKMGNSVERGFLNVASAVPALMALRVPPHDGVRLVEFAVPKPGWWTVDFDSWRAAGGGAAAAKALV